MSEMYKRAGYNVPNVGGHPLSAMLGRFPPGAFNLSDPSYELKGWPVVQGPPQKGDMVAGKGHVGIAVDANNTISASDSDKSPPNGILENNWQSDPRNQADIVIRRCSCGN